MLRADSVCEYTDVIAPEATNISFGVLLSGSGTVWLSHPRFETVPAHVRPIETASEGASNRFEPASRNILASKSQDRPPSRQIQFSLTLASSVSARAPHSPQPPHGGTAPMSVSAATSPENPAHTRSSPDAKTRDT
jgi:hypothetical protein